MVGLAKENLLKKKVRRKNLRGGADLPPIPPRPTRVNIIKSFRAFFLPTAEVVPQKSTRKRLLREKVRKAKWCPLRKQNKKRWRLPTCCTLYIVLCTVYSVYCTLFTIHITLYTVQCTLYSVHSVYCTLFTVYTVQCTM